MSKSVDIDALEAAFRVSQDYNAEHATEVLHALVELRQLWVIDALSIQVSSAAIEYVGEQPEPRPLVDTYSVPNRNLGGHSHG